MTSVWREEANTQKIRPAQGFQIYMDDQLRALLTDREYKKFWEILKRARLRSHR